MTVHTPTIAPHQGIHVNPEALQAVIVAAFLLVAVGIGFLLYRPPAAVVGPAYPDTMSAWRLEFRHGEIDEGRSGPHSDVLQYRAGEINAAKP